MDILIKNFEMPRGDDSIMIVIESDGSVWQKISTTAYFCTGFKAVALPEHHGRLGDLDKIAKRFHSFYEKHLENGSYETAEIWKYAEQEVRQQGTIVEATE